jgi:intracellular multiplication protein IcmL
MTDDNTEKNQDAYQEEVLAEVTARNSFYRDSYRKVLIALNISILSLLVLIISAVYILNHPPQPKYFATYADGRLVPLIPLNDPNITQASLMQWVNTAVVAVNTYDFVNYREQLQHASDYFTQDGWSAYLDSLKASRNLNAVIEKKLVVSAFAKRAPAIVRSGPLDGVFTWTIQIPITVVYQSASASSQQDLVVTLMVKRISTLTNPNGIGIANYIADQGSGDQEGADIGAAAQG